MFAIMLLLAVSERESLERKKSFVITQFFRAYERVTAKRVCKPFCSLFATRVLRYTQKYKHKYFNHWDDLTVFRTRLRLYANEFRKKPFCFLLT